MATQEDLLVSGVSMKTLAKNVSSLTAMLQAPGYRGSNPVAANRSGSIWAGIKPHDAPHYVWDMWVRGCADDGSIPAGSTARREFYKRVDQLTALFQGGWGTAPVGPNDPRPGLLRVQHNLPDGSQRIADLEVVSAFNFAVDAYADPVGKFTVELENPGVYWRDPGLSNAVSAAQVATAFTGATAPLDDGSFTIVGPINQPMISDGYMAGSYFQYLGNIPAGQSLIIDTRPYTITGTGGLAADYSLVRFKGTLGRLMRLVPGPSGGYSATLTGSGTSGATALKLTAYRKYMVG